jgi:hypothetical protein
MTAGTPLRTLLELALLRDGPASGARLAGRVRARKADVLRELRTNPLFERVGDGGSTTWRLAGTGQEPTRSDATTLPPLRKTSGLGVREITQTADAERHEDIAARTNR